MICPRALLITWLVHSLTPTVFFRQRTSCLGSPTSFVPHPVVSTLHTDPSLIQQEVLRLYKRSLSLISSKPSSSQAHFRLFIRHAFRHPALSARDVSAVEHQLRTGGRKVEMLENQGVKSVGVTEEMKVWWDSQVWKGPRSGGGERLAGESRKVEVS